jgi:hypothetical protein
LGKVAAVSQCRKASRLEAPIWVASRVLNLFRKRGTQQTEILIFLSFRGAISDGRASFFAVSRRGNRHPTANRPLNPVERPSPYQVTNMFVDKRR